MILMFALLLSLAAKLTFWGTMAVFVSFSLGLGVVFCLSEYLLCRRSVSTFCAVHLSTFGMEVSERMKDGLKRGWWLSEEIRDFLTEYTLSPYEDGQPHDFFDMSLTTASIALNALLYKHGALQGQTSNG